MCCFNLICFRIKKNEQKNGTHKSINAIDAAQWYIVMKIDFIFRVFKMYSGCKVDGVWMRVASVDVWASMYVCVCYCLHIMCINNKLNRFVFLHETLHLKMVCCAILRLPNGMSAAARQYRGNKTVQRQRQQTQQLVLALFWFHNLMYTMQVQFPADSMNVIGTMPTKNAVFSLLLSPYSKGILHAMIVANIILIIIFCYFAPPAHISSTASMPQWAEIFELISFAIKFWVAVYVWIVFSITKTLSAAFQNV